jgi:hypothetical protein
MTLTKEEKDLALSLLRAKREAEIAANKVEIENWSTGRPAAPADDGWRPPDRLFFRDSRGRLWQQVPQRATAEEIAEVDEALAGLQKPQQSRRRDNDNRPSYEEANWARLSPHARKVHNEWRQARGLAKIPDPEDDLYVKPKKPLIRPFDDSDPEAVAALNEGIFGLAPPSQPTRDDLMRRLGDAKQEWLDGNREPLRKLLLEGTTHHLIDRNTALDIACFLVRADSPTRARRDYARDMPTTELDRRAKLDIERDARAIVEGITGKKRGIESDVLEIAARCINPKASAIELDKIVDEIRELKKRRRASHPKGAKVKPKA